jgi:hypothetical protein
VPWCWSRLHVADHSQRGKTLEIANLASLHCRFDIFLRDLGILKYLGGALHRTRQLTGPDAKTCSHYNAMSAMRDATSMACRLLVSICAISDRVADSGVLTS